jgi:pilus assembly protein CpaC
MYTRSLLRPLAPLAALWLLSVTVLAEEPSAPPVLLPRPSIIYKVQSGSQRLEMIVHTSRILTMDQKIPQAQVNNPDVLEMTPLSPNQIQVSAKSPGVTQVNLWDESKKLYTIDVIVYGDARELSMVLQSTFPNAAIKVTPLAKSVLISGFVDQAEQIDRIIRIAEEYYPKVINNMSIGGCQQVLLHVKIMEVSRTKLRQLGFDFSKVTGANVITSGPAGLLANAFDSTPVIPPSPLSPSAPWAPTVVTGGPGSTFSFGVASGNSAFFGVLNALRQDNLAKIMAEPTLATVSGRPASFLAGGSFYIVPQGLSAPPPQQVQYGTKLNFVTIVLGNGRIHLDVRPEVSNIDPSLTVQGYPGLLLRTAETGVELEAGQTLAIAGLVQSRIEAENAGLPWISELPYVGALFRSVNEKSNEVELLILVTPELVEAMDPCEVPPCGPGEQTTSPTDWELFMKGHLEVPKCCPCDGGCSGQCERNGTDPNGPPPDGMMGPGEPIPAPQPAAAAKPSSPRNRYNSSKPNGSAAASSKTPPDGPPGFIGPVGYDVVK